MTVNEMLRQQMDLNEASVILANKRASLAKGWADSGSMLDRARQILEHAQDYLRKQSEEIGNATAEEIVRATAGWNSELYQKAYKRASGLTDKGCLIALNQADSMINEVVEAYRDVLRERGWTDADLATLAS